MKKLLMVAVLAGLAFSAIACGPTAGTTANKTTGTGGTTNSTEVKK